MIRLADLNPRWLRAIADPLSQGYGGDSFDALTLEPSIHHVAVGGATHWHGWLRAGELVSC